jgi:hypothetical protein
MKSFLTMLGLPVTEQLGSQMWHFAALCSISERSGHRIIFFEEHIQTGRGLRLNKSFNDLPFELVSVNSLDVSDRNYSIYELNKQIAVESAVFKINPAVNYDFRGLFSSYKYWWSIRERVRNMYRFRSDILEKSQSVVESARQCGREVVALHIRRTDYLNGFFVNLNRDYFDAAFKFFDDKKVNYLVFSDDINWCQNEFSHKDNMIYSLGNDASVDMCAMSLCNHNIIANSSFGFWGAFLNKNTDKKMIAPARTLKSDLMIPHLNYCWLPDDFILVDAGNV